MKGLLVKDYRILMVQAKTLAILLVVAIIMMFTMESADFVITYFLMLITILSLGTINYDEIDNGMPFIMTLPAKRKTYAIEKYVFTFINCFGSAVVMFLVYLLTKGFLDWNMTTSEFIGALIGSLAGMTMIATVMIPLYLKVPAEKRRIVLFAFVGIMAVIFFAMNKLSESMQSLDNSVVPFMSQENLIQLAETYSVFIGIGFAALILLMLVISAFLSIRIVEKKEF